ncbi:zinc/iron-chelating domain-containing protein [Campylobacter sp. MIT 12-8780]|uniref:YkgJ family cysteine cluster protein n=1 Tax=unclassified Campylobacter TaxID=2593542 RepID=UPI00115E1BA5|nr:MULTISPECIES: YkgJ family cysteine cluster protein [unclassified Campylobacter]NDJ26857.1 YkgJ family cysteine cluster protein [Campylobacter sp. MIT 19-121]TQR41997.1 zinc/iron-chelating domain-containing protein [Campylobacter sp. MIT 12-8780]
MIYKQGFDFCFDEKACVACGGKCCVGESGNIFASFEELEAIRAFLGLEKAEFVKTYLRKVGLRYSFKECEFENGFACIFFDQKKKNCSIYELRPKQCRTFPFWDYFKKHKEELKNECIGIYF